MKKIRLIEMIKITILEALLFLSIILWLENFNALDI